MEIGVLAVIMSIARVAIMEGFIKIRNLRLSTYCCFQSHYCIVFNCHQSFSLDLSHLRNFLVSTVEQI